MTTFLVLIVVVLLAVALWQLTKIFDLTQVGGGNVNNTQVANDNDNKVNTIDLDFLISKGLAHKKDKIKVLGRGELKSKVDIKVHAFSSAAKTAIEAKGGSALALDKEQ